MGLKFRIDKLEDAPETVREMYAPVDAADPSKGFQLSVDDLPQPEDTTALKNALERERVRADKAMEDAKAKGLDVDAIRKDADERMKTLKDQLDAVDKENKKSLRDKTALELATKLCGESAEVILPHIQKRLRWADEDGKTIIRVLGADGKASAASLSDLEAEFKGNKAFASVIKMGNASGGGAVTKPSVGGAGGSSKGATRTPADAKALLQQSGFFN